MGKKKYLPLLLLPLCVVLFAMSSTCYAYTLNDLNAYINYYEANTDEFTFVSGGNGVDALSKLRNEFYSKYESIFNVNDISKIITCWYNYANSNTTKYVIRVLEPHVNTTFVIHLVNDIYYINGAADGIEYRYRTDTGTWTTYNLSNYQMDIGANWFLILQKGQITYYVNSSIRNFINNNENVLNTQQQYMYAIPRSSLELTSNGNEYVSAFDIRIGQDYSITDYQIKIYTLLNDTKQYQNIQYYCQQATGTNQYIVNLLSEDLFQEDTYYIELYSQGIKWKESEGQKIKITSGSGGSSGDSGSGGSSGGTDLTETNQKIDLVNQSIIAQTQAIISGDKQLRDAIISGDKAILNALTDTSYDGELSLSGDLPVIEIDDPSYNFFSWLMEHIQDTLLDTQVQTLVIPIYDQNYEIRSDIFVFNIEPLKSFISIGWWFVCGVPLLKWVRHFIETLRSGNIPQVDDKSDLLGNVL